MAPELPLVISTTAADAHMQWHDEVASENISDLCDNVKEYISRHCSRTARIAVLIPSSALLLAFVSGILDSKRTLVLIDPELPEGTQHKLLLVSDVQHVICAEDSSTCRIWPESWAYENLIAYDPRACFKKCYEGTSGLAAIVFQSKYDRIVGVRVRRAALASHLDGAAKLFSHLRTSRIVSTGRVGSDIWLLSTFAAFNSGVTVCIYGTGLQSHGSLHNPDTIVIAKDTSPTNRVQLPASIRSVAVTCNEDGYLPLLVSAYNTWLVDCRLETGLALSAQCVGSRNFTHFVESCKFAKIGDKVLLSTPALAEGFVQDNEFEKDRFVRLHDQLAFDCSSTERLALPLIFVNNYAVQQTTKLYGEFPPASYWIFFQCTASSLSLLKSRYDYFVAQVPRLRIVRDSKGIAKVIQRCPLHEINEGRSRTHEQISDDPGTLELLSSVYAQAWDVSDTPEHESCTGLLVALSRRSWCDRSVEEFIHSFSDHTQTEPVFAPLWLNAVNLRNDGDLQSWWSSEQRAHPIDGMGTATCQAKCMLDRGLMEGMQREWIHAAYALTVCLTFQKQHSQENPLTISYVTKIRADYSGEYIVTETLLPVTWTIQQWTKVGDLLADIGMTLRTLESANRTPVDAFRHFNMSSISSSNKPALVINRINIDGTFSKKPHAPIDYISLQYPRNPSFPFLFQVDMEAHNTRVVSQMDENLLKVRGPKPITIFLHILHQLTVYPITTPITSILTAQIYHNAQSKEPQQTLHNAC